MSFLSDTDHLVKYCDCCCLPSTACLKSKRSIDFVLAYHNKPDALKEARRETFLRNLKAKRVTITKSIESQDGKTSFHHIFVPFDVLCDAAEDMGMQFATKENDIYVETWLSRMLKPVFDLWESRDPFVNRNAELLKPKLYFRDRFDKARMSEFINGDNPETFFPAIWRSRIALFIMEKVQWGKNSNEIGIIHLLNHNVFDAAYPVHEAMKCCAKKHRCHSNDRQKLLNEWATFRHIFRYQPLDAVKDYLGHRVAYYFAWFGFYIRFLIPASFLGIICIIYGALSLPFDVTIEEICQPINASLYYMCPHCDRQCSYYLLKDSGCNSAVAGRLFDNDFTPFFTFCMIIWGCFFVKFWKRYALTLAYEWNSLNFRKNEAPRPQYLLKATEVELNPVTMQEQAVMSRRQKVIKLTGTWTVVVFFISLVVGAVIGVIVYRIAIFAVLSSGKVERGAKVIVTVTAAILNLIAINVLKYLYRNLAMKMTEWENPRTMSGYEESFTVKMFWFQFVNTYTSVVYVGLFKSEIFAGWPGNFNHFGGNERFRLEACSPQGCLLETTVQIAVLMIGQQFLGNMVKSVIPFFRRKYNHWRHSEGLKTRYLPTWERDYLLKENNLHVLFWEYQDLVIQFGFVTIFAAAFPLAPLVALVTNLVDLRMDAINVLRNFRRSVAFMRCGIGAWRNIIATIVMIALPVNAFLLALSSQFIPNMMYKHVFSPDGTMKGAVNFSLSFFNVNDYKDYQKPDDPRQNVDYEKSYCRYPGYHDSTKPYSYNIYHYEIFTARLIFAFVFQWIITVISSIIMTVFDDQPQELKLKLKRQEYLAAQALREYKVKTGKCIPDLDPNSVSDTEDEDAHKVLNGVIGQKSDKENVRDAKKTDGSTNTLSTRLSSNSSLHRTTSNPVASKLLRHVSFKRFEVLSDDEHN